MSVDTKHPDYLDRVDEWRMMRDTIRGTTAVKKEGECYLPMPSGFRAAQNGSVMYDAYKRRARFPSVVRPTVRGMVGIIHRIESKIELSPKLEPLRERASKDGLTLSAFHARITTELLSTGRYSVLADAEVEGSNIPYLSGYPAEKLINWSEDLDFFVVDECRLERQPDGFSWMPTKEYRVLELKDGRFVQTPYLNGIKQEEIGVSGAGRTGAITQVPFVVIGAIDLSVDPDEPPLLGVAEAALSAYRLHADYRHQLYMSGQETPTFTNLPQEKIPAIIGAGTAIALPEDADFKYVGPDCAGIDAHRTAIADEMEAAVQAGARVFDNTTKGGVESGDALRIRASANTATLVSIAKSSAAGLEKALRNAAILAGDNPEKVKVEPNLDFLDTVLDATEAEALVRMWQANAISYKTLYENLQRGEIASIDRDDEEEQALIDESEQTTLDPPVNRNPKDLRAQKRQLLQRPTEA